MPDDKSGSGSATNVFHMYGKRYGKPMFQAGSLTVDR